MEELKGFKDFYLKAFYPKGLLYEIKVRGLLSGLDFGRSQGQNLALTVLCVPYFLDRGTAMDFLLQQKTIWWFIVAQTLNQHRGFPGTKQTTTWFVFATSGGLSPCIRTLERDPQ